MTELARIQGGFLDTLAPGGRSSTLRVQSGSALIGSNLTPVGPIRSSRISVRLVIMGVFTAKDVGTDRLVALPASRDALPADSW